MSQLEMLLTWQIDEVGNLPALLMYTLGNELPYSTTGNGAKLVTQVNSLIQFARNYQQSKWNRTIPITSPVIDIPQYYDYLVPNLAVDVFTANAGYRGTTFTNLWTGTPPTFSGFFNLSCATGKPLLIGEMGWVQVNNSQDIAQPTWFNELYYNLVENIDNGCIGGIFFEWNDEPQKPAANQRTMGLVRYEVTDNSDGTTSVDMDTWTADTLVKKTDVNIWTSLTNGTWQGKPYNYNASIWDLLGRPPAILGTFNSSPCSGTPVITGATATTSTFATTGATPTATSGIVAPTTGSAASLSLSLLLIALAAVAGLAL